MTLAAQPQNTSLAALAAAAGDNPSGTFAREYQAGQSSGPPPPAPTAALQQIAVTFGSGGGGPSSTVLPAGSTVFNVRIAVTAAFPPGATASVGDALSPNRYSPTGDSDLDDVGVYDTPQATPSVPLGVIVTVTGPAGAGAATAYITYSTPTT